MPYFKLAEAKNFDNPELYQIYIDIYSRKGIEDYPKIFKYTTMFLSSNSQKQMPESSVRRLYAISKYLSIPTNDVTIQNMEECIKDLSKIEESGDKKVSKIIAGLTLQVKSMKSGKEPGTALKNLCLSMLILV